MKKVLIDGWDFTDPVKPGEVAKAFGVSRKTVTQWGQAGTLASIRTPGGQRRYSRQQVEHLLARGEAS